MRKITSTDFTSVELYTIYKAAAAAAGTDITRRQTPDRTTHQPIRERLASYWLQLIGLQSVRSLGFVKDFKFSFERFIY